MHVYEYTRERGRERERESERGGGGGREGVKEREGGRRERMRERGREGGVEREKVNKVHIDGDVAGGGTNVAFLSMTCQFSAIISSECPGAQVLNIQHYTTSFCTCTHA